MPKTILTDQIVLTEIKWLDAYFEIIGDTPLVTRPFTKKAGDMIVAAGAAADSDLAPGLPTVKRKAVKVPLNLAAEFEESTYRIPEGSADAGPDGKFVGAEAMIASAFKKAMVDGAQSLFHINGDVIKTYFHVLGEFLPLSFDHKVLTTDHSRNARGMAIILHRPYYYAWGTTLHIMWIDHLMTSSQVATLVNAAGVMGVGEHRPSAPKARSGQNGMFKLKQIAFPMGFEPRKKGRKTKDSAKEYQTTEKPSDADQAAGEQTEGNQADDTA